MTSSLWFGGKTTPQARQKYGKNTEKTNYTKARVGRKTSGCVLGHVYILGYIFPGGWLITQAMIDIWHAIGQYEGHVVKWRRINVSDVSARQMADGWFCFREESWGEELSGEELSGEEPWDEEPWDAELSGEELSGEEPWDEELSGEEMSGEEPWDEESWDGEDGMY